MNPCFQNILVFQDANRDSVEAMKWASRMASPTSSIKILDVQPPLSAMWQDLFNNDFEKSPVYVRESSLHKQTKRIVFKTPNLEVGVRIGTPIVQIAREILSGSYDLIVKEALGKTSFLLFGSLDMRLIRYSPIPVWLAQKESSSSCSRILVALNPDAEHEEIILNQRLLQHASNVALKFNAKLFVVGAYQTHDTIFPVLDEEFRDRAEKRAKTIRRHAREKIERLVDKSLKPVDRNNIILAEGWPDEAILNAVESVRPQLLVLGSVARQGLSGLMVGNTAERVLRQVKCSVLTIKPLEFVCPIEPDKPRQAHESEGRFAF